MAKKGMKRPDRTHTQPRNQMESVPELQGKAHSGKETARPIVTGTSGANQKVFHGSRPISSDAYPEIDNDLARDNLENDIPAADLNDL